MKAEDFKILFMDDEISSSSRVKQAYQTLIDAGYQVDKCDNMATVLDSYYKEFYHLYLLDIDMSATEQSLETKEMRGMTVGEILRRLSSTSEVLIYSARGEVNDWFKAANYHFQGYIHKGDKLSKLIDKVDSIRENYQLSFDFDLGKEDLEKKRALLYYGKQAKEFFSRDQLVTWIKKTEIEEVNIVTSLKKTQEQIESKKYSVVLIFNKEISNRPRTLQKLEQILAVQPFPQVIIWVCGASERDKNNVLPIVNLRPFRLLNLNWKDKFVSKFKNSIAEAITWYGKKEVLLPPDGKEVVKNPLSEEEFQEIVEDEEYDLDMDDYNE